MIPRRLLVLVSGMKRGGTELRLLDVLRHLDQRRYVPTLCVLHEGSLLVEAEGFSVHGRLARCRGDPLVVLRLWRFFRRERPDLVWCVGTGLMALLGHIRGLWLRVPVVVSVHGLEYPDARIFSLPERWMIRSTSRFVVLGVAYRERLIQEGVGPEQIVVQPNGIDVSRFHCARRSLGKGEEMT